MALLLLLLLSFLFQSVLDRVSFTVSIQPVRKQRHDVDTEYSCFMREEQRIDNELRWVNMVLFSEFSFMIKQIITQSAGAVEYTAQG